VPLGAVLVSRRIADVFTEKPYIGGLTYSGHPLACAAGIASIRALREEHIVENARAVGEAVLGPGLKSLMARHPSVGEVRGRGCFWGVELVRNRETREMMAPFNASPAQMGPMGDLGRAAMERGLSLLIHWNVVVIAPPLVITPEEAQRGLEILDDILQIADAAAA
jgi:taurine--2-oxoglutarate transaminase